MANGNTKLYLMLVIVGGHRGEDWKGLWVSGCVPGIGIMCA